MTIENIAENLWVRRYPLSLLGADAGRTVTLLRLPASGELVIHSSGPFSAADAAEFRTLGTPGWLVEATNVHDTFARAGAAAFPDLPYLGPPGFARVAGVPARSLAEPPTAWAGVIDVLALGGVPRVREHVFLHRPTRTLIVADLVFNVGPAVSGWTRFLLRWAADLRGGPGVSRVFRRLAVREVGALRASLETMLAWDFDRVIVGHGDIIARDGKARVTAALAAAGFLG